MKMNENRIMKVLLSPRITEKASLLNEHNQYTFNVMKDASKAEIKQAVELFFKVKVASVNVINIKPKKVRVGRIEGTRKTQKKACVRTQPGNVIDFTGTQA
jgi:large subunit ribosomal protein L23